MTTPIPTTPRQTIQARFPDGRAFEAPVGTPIEAFVRAAEWDRSGKGRTVAVLMNRRLRELSIPLQTDADLVPITTADSDGSRIYRRSLTFLMVVAAAELFPAYTITIMHSMPFGGYYCEFDGVRATQTDLDALKTRMRQLVEADLPISQVRVPLDEALQLFRDWGDEEKAQLFAKRRKDYLTLYELNGERDYFHGFMAPRTDYLELFDLRPYNKGFILQFPRRHQPDVLQPFEDEPVLARVFQEYSQWLALIGVPKVSALNETLQDGRILQAILVSEALHQRQLNRIANEIVERGSHERHTAVRRSSVRIVLISGPTSAGKTTFSKRLAIQLLARGIRPVTIGMDNYFVNRELTPRDETGAYDFEAIEAVDIAFFQQQMRQLLQGETIIQPRFNFHTGRREEGEPLTIGPEHIILIEGIHGLNPRLVQNVPPEAIYRIFISAFTQLNLDKHNRIPTTDTRLLRRIVRDATHRGYTAADTIARWPSVRRGEKRHIFPYQSNADVFFNSALVYELAALKPFAEPLLLQVEPDAPERIEANRLRAFLQWFDPLPPDLRAHIPGDSILREFMGGSILEHYDPGLLL